MANLNEVLCAQSAGNSGISRCFFDPKMIIGSILTPKGYELDLDANAGNLQTTLVKEVQKSNKLLRLFPFYNFDQPTDSTEQKTIQTLSSGAKYPVREGFNDWAFQYIPGGLTLHKNARKFNGSAYDWFFVDSEMRIIGIEGSTSRKLKAIPSDGGFFWADPWKLNDGSKVTEYRLHFVCHVRYTNDFVAFVKADFDLPTTVKGLKNLVLVAEQSGTAGTYNLTIKDEVGTNMADLYPTELASTTLIKVTDAATGTDCDITGVTVGNNADGEKCFKVVMDTNDSDYTGATNLNFDLDTPEALATAGIDSYESTGPSTVAKA